MSLGLQLLIVTLLVAAAMVFAAWRLMGGALRLRVVEAMLRLLPAVNTAQPKGLTGWLQNLAARQRTATGCSACERNPAKRS
jgi:hypothetical protein